MKRVKFSRTEQYESEGRNKGPIYEQGSVHDFDDAFADRWIRRGVAVEVGDAEAGGGSSVELDANKNLGEYKVVELRDIAAAEGIDLGDATLKADIVSAIELAREERAAAV